MEYQNIFIFASLALGLYVAWNIGSNDVANSMGPAVGSKAITFKQAVLIAAILNVIGATFIGSHVTETVRKGIVDPSFIQDPKLALIGFMSALLAAGFWITLATWKSLPISTTHSIIGSLIGFGLVVGGREMVNWGKLGQVVLSWIVSPLFAGLLAFFIFKLLVKFIFKSPNRKRAMAILSPFLIAVTVFIIFFSLVFKTPLGAQIQDKFPLALGVALLTIFLLWLWIRKFTRKVGKVESIFKRLQIITCCYIALSQGANDVANAIGPVASIFSIARMGEISCQVTVPLWLLGLGGIGIALGISTWGYRVMETVGKRITKLNNSRGFTISFAAATSILLASKMGMPVSTTHAAIGAVVGIGLARGLDAVDLGVVKRIVYSWLLTVPAAALLTIPIYWALLKLCG